MTQKTKPIAIPKNVYPEPLSLQIFIAHQIRDFRCANPDSIVTDEVITEDKEIYFKFISRTELKNKTVNMLPDGWDKLPFSEKKTWVKSIKEAIFKVL